MGETVVYPKPLKKGDKIAVTAPSSGVGQDLHILLYKTKRNLENRGYKVVEGQTIWTNQKLISAPKEKRAKELMEFLLDDSVKAIIPPWGGEFLMEILPLLDWEKLRQAEPKWILGYSDTSTFLFTYTLLTGHASAHGTNYVDLSADIWDDVTAKWLEVLGTGAGESVNQHSSEKYQSSWDRAFENPGTGFYPDTPTSWNILGNHKEVSFSGRLIGGCQNTLSTLAGTHYAPVRMFSDEYAKQEGLIWYLESVEWGASEIYRYLWQMKMNGWFENTNGIIIGRPLDYSDSGDFQLMDALNLSLGDMGIPVVYDADIGHVPPQMTLVNGALATVEVKNQQGKLKMEYK